MKTDKISEALNLIKAKKNSLRQAFLELESHSSSLSSFDVSWNEIDSHFSSIEFSLRSQFDAIESTTLDKQVKSGNLESNIGPQSRPARKEMKDLCERMDGKGLRRYIDDNHKELSSIKEEIFDALKSSSDPALIVLDAMEDFYNVEAKGRGDGEFRVKEVRRTCLMLLEKLMSVVGSGEVSGYAREKARNLAFVWKGKVSEKDSESIRALGFLTLVAAYDLGSEFDVNDIVEMLVETAKFKESVNLCRMLIMFDKIPVVVRKLMETKKQLLAVKFICEFSLADKFPPVPLLKAYVNDVKQLAENIRKKGNYSLRAMNEAAVKEENGLKAVLKYIEDHKLESEYPPKILENRINDLNSKKSHKKRSATDMVNGKVQQQQHNRQSKSHQPSGSNQSHGTTIATPTSVQVQAMPNVHSFTRPYQQAHLPPAASSTVTPYMIQNPDVSGFSGSSQNVVQYLGNQDIASYTGSTPAVNYSSSVAGLYNTASTPGVNYGGSVAGVYNTASTPAVNYGSSVAGVYNTASTPAAYYGSSVAGVYNTAGGTAVHPANLIPSSSNVYTPEAQLSSAYYSSATANGGGYSIPPQFHPQYYPQ